MVNSPFDCIPLELYASRTSGTKLRPGACGADSGENAIFKRFHGRISDVDKNFHENWR
jgi:hypothetical protein